MTARQLIGQLDRISRLINRAAGVISALLLAYVFLHIMIEIVLRVGFSTSTFVLDEFVGYAVAAMTFLSLAYTLDTGGLIRVDLVAGRLKGRVRRWLELFCIASTFAMAVFIAWWVGRNVLRNWNRGAVSESIAEVPLWIPIGAVWLGIVLFAMQLFVYFLRTAAGGPIVSAESPETQRIPRQADMTAGADKGGR